MDNQFFSLFRFYIMSSMILAALHLFGSCIVLLLHRQGSATPPLLVRVGLMRPIRISLRLGHSILKWVKIKFCLFKQNCSSKCEKIKYFFVIKTLYTLKLSSSIPPTEDYKSISISNITNFQILVN